jgi:hypothetical protein
MSSYDQLPFIVSHNPSSRAKAAKSQNTAGMPGPVSARCRAAVARRDPDAPLAGDRLLD